MENPTSNGNGEIDLRALVGSVIATARFKDGSTQEVRVSEVDIESMEQLLTRLTEPKRRVELYCGKITGWADRLTTSSLVELLGKGKEINDPLFDAWYQDRQAVMEILNPGFLDQIQKIVAEGAQKAAEKALASSSSVSPSQLAPA